jgi:hypothetical protein
MMDIDPLVRRSLKSEVGASIFTEGRWVPDLGGILAQRNLIAFKWPERMRIDTVDGCLRVKREDGTVVDASSTSGNLPLWLLPVQWYTVTAVAGTTITYERFTVKG